MASAFLHIHVCAYRHAPVIRIGVVIDVLFTGMGLRQGLGYGNKM